MGSTLERRGQASRVEPNPELFRMLASRGSGSGESVAPPGLRAAGGGGAVRHDDENNLRLSDRRVNTLDALDARCQRYQGVGKGCHDDGLTKS
jgi:hypothetical protein